MTSAVEGSPDYILDIRGLGDAGGSDTDAADARCRSGNHLCGRPWIAVHWRCCHVYSRIYRNAAGTEYAGRCPSCGNEARAAVGAGGTNQRFFEAG